MTIKKFWDDSTPQAYKTALEAINTELSGFELDSITTAVTSVKTSLDAVKSSLDTIDASLAADIGVAISAVETEITAIVTVLTGTVSSAITGVGTTIVGDDNSGLGAIEKLLGYLFKDQENAKYTILKTIEDNIVQGGTFFEWINKLITKGLAKEGGKLLENFDEEQAKLARLNIATIFANISSEKETLSALEAAAKSSVKGQGFKGLIDLMNTGLIGIAGMLPGYGTMTEAADQILRSKTRKTLPSMDQIVRSFWRGYDPKVINDYLVKSGYSAEATEILRLGMEPLVGINDLAKIRSILSLNQEQERWLLNSLGYSGKPDTPNVPSQAQMASELLKIQPEMADLLELYRRGEIKVEDFGKRLSYYGHALPEQALYEKLSYRLPTFDMLFELQRRGLVNDELVGGELKKLGYAPDILAALPNIRFNKLQPESLSRAYFRKILPKEDFIKRIMMLGYNQNDANILEQTSWVLPTPQDIIRFGVREVFTPQIAKKFRQFEDYPKDLTTWGEKIGMSEDVLKMYWAAHWDLPAPGQGFDMFHRGIIDKAELETLLRALDVMPFWRDKMINLAFRLVPRRTLPRLRRQELITEDDLTKRFIKLGYEEADAKILAASATIDADASKPKLSRAELQDAYAHDQISEHILKETLKDEGYDNKAINYFVYKAQLKKQKIDTAGEKEGKDGAARQAKELTKTDILNGFEDGLITIAETREYLTALGYDADIVNFYVNRVVYDIQRKSRIAKGKIEVKRYLELDISESALTSKLVKLGFSEPEARRQTSIAKDAKLLGEEIDESKERLPTLSDITDWLKLGIIDAERWSQYMKELGYSDETIRYYLTEILVKMEG